MNLFSDKNIVYNFGGALQKLQDKIIGEQAVINFSFACENTGAAIMVNGTWYGPFDAVYYIENKENMMGTTFITYFLLAVSKARNEFVSFALTYHGSNYVAVDLGGYLPENFEIYGVATGKEGKWPLTLYLSNDNGVSGLELTCPFKTSKSFNRGCALSKFARKQ